MCSRPGSSRAPAVGVCRDRHRGRVGAVVDSRRSARAHRRRSRAVSPSLVPAHRPGLVLVALAPLVGVGTAAAVLMTGPASQETARAGCARTPTTCATSTATTAPHSGGDTATRRPPGPADDSGAPAAEPALPPASPAPPAAPPARPPTSTGAAPSMLSSPTTSATTTAPPADPVRSTRPLRSRTGHEGYGYGPPGGFHYNPGPVPTRPPESPSGSAAPPATSGSPASPTTGTTPPSASGEARPPSTTPSSPTPSTSR